jgi:diguanylate cyclase (GGDEF)-like protein
MRNELAEVATCPTCGGSGRVAGVVPASGEEQALSDRDQTASDQDQTWSDQDQAASDRDSDSSVADQDASDQVLAAGGDPGVHEQTRVAREHAASVRDEVSALRDESAASRLETAEERDAAAAERDREADERDLAAAEHGEHPDPLVAEIREQAARNRARAAVDRARAAADREAAARDRADARRAQGEAEHALEVAATDELTGAWTRRFGLVQMAHELERARRTGGTLTIAFVDSDHLKKVNDTHGHHVGDRLLSLVGETIRNNLRTYDVIVRYGGDEFLCAMSNVGRDTAVERMSAVAATLSRAEIGYSITFGLAEFHPDEGLQELIARADADLLAVRRSRRTGRLRRRRRRGMGPV